MLIKAELPIYMILSAFTMCNNKYQNPLDMMMGFYN